MDEPKQTCEVNKTGYKDHRGRSAETETRSVVARDWDGGSICFKSTRLPFEVMNMFWKKIEVVVAQYFNSLNASELCSLKWLILCNEAFILIFKNLVSTFNPRVYLYLPKLH